MTPGQSMGQGGPPVFNHRPPPAPVDPNWTPPVAIGAPPLLPPGISLPPSGGSMMRKIVPKKLNKVEHIPPTPVAKTVEPSKKPSKEPAKEPTKVPTKKETPIVPHKEHAHHENTEKIETTARPKLQESSSTKTIINALCMAIGLILLL